MRPDIYYEIVDVSTSSDERLMEFISFMSNIFSSPLEERPPSLPYTLFSAEDIRSALEYMEKVKHIGKIVVAMPDQGKSLQRFSKESTYLITGGLGGIGLEVALWMVERGASNIILSGRSPPNSVALSKIQIMKDSGCRVEIVQGDVSSIDDVMKIPEIIKQLNLPHLKGIMHCAGILLDFLYKEQDWGKYETVSLIFQKNYFLFKMDYFIVRFCDQRFLELGTFTRCL